MALAIDASTPPIVSTTSSVGALTTASFTPPVGALLVACYGDAFGRTITQPTNTGGAVTWDAAPKVAVALGNASTAIWLGTVTTSAAMTITETPNTTSPSWAFGVIVITGQAATQNGATNSASANPGIPSVTLASLVGTNSLVLGSISNADNATIGTPGTNQSQTFNGQAFTYTDVPNGSSVWVQYDTRMSLAAGSSDTINDTAPNIHHAIAAAEILAVSTADPNTLRTLSSPRLV